MFCMHKSVLTEKSRIIKCYANTKDDAEKRRVYQTYKQQQKRLET